jgi:molybdopterin-guanine dinucleotide biosynthesis protein A
MNMDAMNPFLTSPPAAGGVILAGGRALRMGGGDKGRQRIGTHDILSHLVAVLAPQVSALTLNANGDPARFHDFGLPVLADTLADSGPLAGLLAGLDWAEGCCLPWLLTAPTDTPFLPPDLLLRLGHGVCDGRLAAVAASGGRRHPVVGLWSTSLREPLRHFLLEQGERKMGLWAAQCNAATVEWPDEPRDPFFNINQPEERAQAAAQLNQRPYRAGAVVLPHRHAAHALLADFAALQQTQGVAVAGLLQEGSKSAGDAPDAITLADINTGERFAIMLSEACAGSCAVDPSAVAAASAVLRRAIASGDALLLVNKFGPLEAEGGGLADEMLQAMATEQPLLTTVSVNRLESWLRFTGGMCELLPPDPAALSAWWERNRPEG